jgi:hypothetical protein
MGDDGMRYKKEQGEKAAKRFGMTEDESDLMAKAFKEALKEFMEDDDMSSTSDLIDLCLKRLPIDWPLKNYVVLGTAIRSHEEQHVKIAKLMKILEDD